MRNKTILTMILFAVAATGRASAASPGTPQTWGTTNTSYVTVPEWAFSPSSSTVAYSDIGNPARRYALTPLSFFFASPTIPNGALLQSVEFDFCNSQPMGGSSMLLLLYGASAGNSNLSLLTQVTGAANQGCYAAGADLSGLNYTVDNVEHRLLLETAFGPNGDSTTSFSGVIVGYRLQVTPVPPSPSFADVPESDPAYQYVEALAMSGVTGGCGNGDFCPDAVVTRRQMAVFLSKALGLFFP
jgi:hypothetical protein